MLDVKYGDDAFVDEFDVEGANGLSSTGVADFGVAGFGRRSACDVFFRGGVQGTEADPEVVLLLISTPRFLVWSFLRASAALILMSFSEFP